MPNLTNNLMFWYKQNKRKFPWREKKNLKNPYFVMVSEIMLQQTNTNTEIDYFKKFILKWPNIYSLSNARLNEILFFWQGLGFYKRAHNLLDTSKILIKKYNGKIPTNYKDLINLPGIGEYTANAILTLAYKKKRIGLDVNINRVASRLFNLNIKDKKKIYQKLSYHLPNKKTDDFMQALMDVGATLCKKKITKCHYCPINNFCIFFKENKQIESNIIYKKKKKFLFIYLIKFKNEIILREKKEGKLLNNLMEIPNYLFNKKVSLEVAKRKAPLKLNWKKVKGKLNTKISNFDLETIFFETELKKKFFLKDSVWVNKNKLKKIPISSLMRNFLVYLNCF